MKKINVFIPLALAIMLASMSVHAQDKTHKREIPFEESFKAGSKVEFVVTTEERTEIVFTNISQVAATVIYHVTKDGKPLPEGTIAPLKWRTKELEPEKELVLVFDWKKAYEITIDIQGGDVKLKIGPE